MDSPYALDYQIINKLDDDLDYYFQQKLIVNSNESNKSNESNESNKSDESESKIFRVFEKLNLNT